MPRVCAKESRTQTDSRAVEGVAADGDDVLVPILEGFDAIVSDAFVRNTPGGEDLSPEMVRMLGCVMFAGYKL